MRLSPAQSRLVSFVAEGGELFCNFKTYGPCAYYDAWTEPSYKRPSNTAKALIAKGVLEKGEDLGLGWSYLTQVRTFKMHLTPTGLEALKEYQRNVK